MPWFPDFASAAEMARRQTRAAGLADPVAHIAAALCRAVAAHDKHEEKVGHADPDWPDRHALVMPDDQAHSVAPGAGT